MDQARTGEEVAMAKLGKELFQIQIMKQFVYFFLA